MSSGKSHDTSKELKKAIAKEGQLFEEYYTWLEQHMPARFFEEIEREQVMLIAHNLMGFHLQSYFSHIHLKDCAFALRLESPDADLKNLKHYNLFGIKNYQTYVSDAAAPFPGIKAKLRIAAIYFTVLDEHAEEALCQKVFSKEEQAEIYTTLQKRVFDLSKEAFSKLVHSMNARFLRSLNKERLILSMEMLLRAKTRDYCQYEVRYNEDFAKTNSPSMQIVLAWRNTPKHLFLYRLAKTIYRHNLTMMRMNATYLNPYEKESTLLLSLGLHGMDEKPAWEATDIGDFLQEMATLKYFDEMDQIETIFVDSGLIRGNLGTLLRTIVSFVHQVLVHADPNLYSLQNIEEGLCRHVELTIHLLHVFEMKFHPEKKDEAAFEKGKEDFLNLVNTLDTGNEINDERRKNILKQAMHFIQYTLKTNFYRNNKSALSFRLDPTYLTHVPYDREAIFPEIPFAIFFIRGMHFIGFHIRFKDLSRGGLRTVMPQLHEQMVAERDYVFSECYNLAFTQQKKNKDIPEGGSKAVIFLEPLDCLRFETDIYTKELHLAGYPKARIAEKIITFQRQQKTEYLYQTQRAFIHSLLTLVNCEEDGTLRAKHVVDYWKKPEYIYLGPDENMHNVMIEWIANYSRHCRYKPGIAFISSKPHAGINHKEYGITSFGVNVYMEQALHYLGINPKKDPFTIKIAGGPDGDVAGNQIMNLAKFYPKTAKLLALTDISGTVYDPNGLDLEEMEKLFHTVNPIHAYPFNKLSKGGFLLDLQTKKEHKTYAQQTLCYQNIDGRVKKTWLSGNEMNHLYRHNLHQVKTDIFIPAGGRPRTLNKGNWEDFLDSTGQPTSRAIIEGANLYLTPIARKNLESLKVLIIKDSSANKGGVICSSLEVLAGLILSEEEFLNEKKQIMKEILEFIRQAAKNEATLLLQTHKETQTPLTDLSEQISHTINKYTYQIYDFLENIDLTSDPKNPLMQAVFNYCLPLFKEKYASRILDNIPPVHKKAMISCYIAAKVVYKKGLSWQPTIVDILPVIAKDPTIM